MQAKPAFKQAKPAFICIAGCWLHLHPFPSHVFALFCHVFCEEANKLQMEREKKRLAQNAIENCHPQMLNISCLLCLTSNIHVLYFMRYIGYRVEIAKNINTGLPGYCDKTLIVTVLAIPIPKRHYGTDKFTDIVTVSAKLSVIVTVLADTRSKIRLKLGFFLGFGLIFNLFQVSD